MNNAQWLSESKCNANKQNYVGNLTLNEDSPYYIAPTGKGFTRSELELYYDELLMNIENPAEFVREMANSKYSFPDDYISSQIRYLLKSPEMIPNEPNLCAKIKTHLNRSDFIRANLGIRKTSRQHGAVAKNFISRFIDNVRVFSYEQGNNTNGVHLNVVGDDGNIRVVIKDEAGIDTVKGRDFYAKIVKGDKVKHIIGECKVNYEPGSSQTLAIDDGLSISRFENCISVLCYDGFGYNDASMYRKFQTTISQNPNAYIVSITMLKNLLLDLND